MEYSFLKTISANYSSEKDDSSIWRDFKSGDEEAFILIYQKYANILYGYGCRFSDDHEIVKDCLQDFFVYLREKRLGLGNPTSLKFYLLKAFKRRVIAYLKKRKKERGKKSLYKEFRIEHFSELVYIVGQEDSHLRNLEKALKLLNSEEREAIYYYYYQNLSYQEIAELLGFSHISSARRIIYRALSKMRKHIKYPFN